MNKNVNIFPKFMCWNCGGVNTESVAIFKHQLCISHNAWEHINTNKTGSALESSQFIQKSYINLLTFSSKHLTHRHSPSNILYPLHKFRQTPLIIYSVESHIGAYWARWMNMFSMGGINGISWLQRRGYLQSAHQFIPWPAAPSVGDLGLFLISQIRTPSPHFR